MKKNIKKLEQKVKETQEMVEFFKSKTDKPDKNNDRISKEVEKLAEELKNEKLNRLKDIERLESKVNGKDRELNQMRQTFAENEKEAATGCYIYIYVTFYDNRTRSY